MGYKKALEVLRRGETPSDKAPELGLTPKNVALEDLGAVAVETLGFGPAHDSSGAGLEATRGDSENEDKKPSPPDEEHSDVLEAELEAPQPTEESADYPTEQPLGKEPAAKPGKQHVEVEMGQATPARIGEIETEAVEGATGYEGGAEGNLKEGAEDEATPDSALFLGSKAADELKPEGVNLAAATILPLSLLGSEKAWVWIVVLVCLAIAGYFLLEWYSRRSEVTSLPREAVKTSSGDTVRDFLDNY